jgi:hypothetical protein
MATMGRKSISPETTTEFVRLHRRGQSYRSIGRTFDVDWRTVKSHLKKVEDEREQAHWEAVARSVDSQFLEEHYAMLRSVAMGVLSAVRTEPLFGQADQTASRLLTSLGEYAVTEFVGATLEARGIDLRVPPSAAAPDHLPGLTPERVTELLMDSLFEHEPVLHSQIDRWCERWERFQSNRRDLTVQAIDLCKQSEVDDVPALRIGSAAAYEVMVLHLQGRRADYPPVRKNDDDTCTLVFRPGTPEDNTIEGSEEKIAEYKTTYEHVCEQMALKARFSPVMEAYRSMAESCGKVRDSVDRIMLRGRPNGRCSTLCPTAIARTQ